jgi:hypothetical protein
MRRGALVLVAVLALVLTGCTVMTPKTEGVERCQDHLRAEIELALPEPAAGWLESTLVVDHVTLTQHGEGEGDAYDYVGTATMTLVDGSALPIEWTCSSRTVDGKTQAALQTINGICTTNKKNLTPEQCP